MPEFKGFKGEGPNQTATVHFGEARVFKPASDGSWQITPNPHTKDMSREDIIAARSKVAENHPSHGFYGTILEAMDGPTATIQVRPFTVKPPVPNP